jgi:hypothetical protein
MNSSDIVVGDLIFRKFENFSTGARNGPPNYQIDSISECISIDRQRIYFKILAIGENGNISEWEWWKVVKRIDKETGVKKIDQQDLVLYSHLTTKNKRFFDLLTEGF